MLIWITSVQQGWLHGCCGGVTPFNVALANYEDCDVLLEVHFTITILLCSIVSFFASSCSCDFCHWQHKYWAHFWGSWRAGQINGRETTERCFAVDICQQTGTCLSKKNLFFFMISSIVLQLQYYMQKRALIAHIRYIKIVTRLEGFAKCRLFSQVMCIAENFNSPNISRRWN